MQVWAPVPGSVWSRSTPRKRGAVGRRSAGYWNVNAGCGVYFIVSHIPFARSTRKMVLRNLMMVCINGIARLKPSRYGFALRRSFAVGVEPLGVERRLAVARHD